MSIAYAMSSNLVGAVHYYIHVHRIRFPKRLLNILDGGQPEDILRCCAKQRDPFAHAFLRRFSTSALLGGEEARAILSIIDRFMVTAAYLVECRHALL